MLYSLLFDRFCWDKFIDEIIHIRDLQTWSTEKHEIFSWKQVKTAKKNNTFTSKLDFYCEIFTSIADKMI
jgi:hypothetical protein